MEQQIYNSSNEESLLRSMGPFRANLTDCSISGIISSLEINVGIKNFIGEIKIYGKKS